jgi:hypothetical protein
MSVSGSGKTVSMLQLKSKVKELIPESVVVAHLGFNMNLNLSGFENEFIDAKNLDGAEQVLACRLAAATIISMVNHEMVTKTATIQEGVQRLWHTTQVHSPITCCSNQWCWPHSILTHLNRTINSHKTSCS